MVLPEKFKCVVTNWDYIYGLCRNVANDIKASGKQPDIIIALARGGWFAGRVLCDFLGMNDLTSLKIEHYTGTAAISGTGPQIRYPLSESAIKDKHVLVVDDIADTGKSLSKAKEYITAQGAKTVQTSTLQFLSTSEIRPDFMGEVLEEWAWVIFPWNFIEDMSDLIFMVMKKSSKKTWTVQDIKAGLYESHFLDSFSFEIAQPGRMPEVLNEMSRRGILTKVEHTSEKMWQLKDV